jgi:uncharacterized HhH-GPD family protein
MITMHVATSPEANDYLTQNPFALLVGMLLDQQVPMETAFTAPYALRERLGHDFDAKEIDAMDSTALEELFRQRPALHRFPAAMAKRVQQLAHVLVERYDGDARAVWSDATDGVDLVRRLAALPGFGEQKARIFAALLGKQFDVRPNGWRDSTGPYGEDGSFRSVADVVDEASLRKVRGFKREQKASAKAK